MASAIEECAICYSDLKTQSYTINTCSHAFHNACLNAAAAAGTTTCPMCRGTIDAFLYNPAAPVPPAPPMYANDDPLPANNSFPTAEIFLKFYTEVNASEPVVEFDGIVELTVSDEMTGERSGVDIIILADISGSMQGAKINMLKKTISVMSGDFTDKDRMALIAFDSYATCIMPLKAMTEANKAIAVAKAEELEVRDSTNIGAAFEMARQILEQRRFKNGVSAILLLSDGADSYAMRAEAVTDVSRLAAIYSVGIGADHDSRLLSSVARIGKGSFSYAADEPGIPESVGATYGMLTSVVGTNAILKIPNRPPQTIGFLSLDEKKTFLFTTKSDAELTTTLEYNAPDAKGIEINRFLPTTASEPVSEETLVLIDLTRNRELVAAAMKAAADAVTKKAKEILDDAKTKILASKSKDHPHTAALLKEINEALEAPRDQATMIARASQHAAQTGGMHMTPLGAMASQSLRMRSA